MSEDFYALLGVSPQATQDEIKKAYRRMARQWHPDANQHDPQAEARFKEITRAYETLSDPERRARYDRFGTDDANAGDPFGGGLGDLFEAFFGGNAFGGSRGGRRRTAGPPAGPDLEVVANLDFEEAVFGCQQDLTVRTAAPCEECEATGAAKGSAPQTCPDCEGTGQVRMVRQSFLGQMVSATTCRRCGGLGRWIAKPCAACGGEGRTVTDKTYTVDVPGGVDTGATLRLAGRGAVGPRGGGYGDLYVKIRVRPHARFERQGNDLYHRLHLGLSQAALGAHIAFETLDGEEDLLVPAGTQPGKLFRLRGRGVPALNGRGRGDLLVEIAVDVPSDLAPEEEDLLRRFAELRGEDVAPPDSGFFSRIRSAFR